MKATFEADFSSFQNEVQNAITSMQDLESESTKVGPAVASSVDRMKNSYAQFDALLNSVGIHFNQQTRALEEVTAAAGKTFSELGALASAGLVVGTAMAAWDFGRTIAGWAGTDKAIGDATARLLGWGDVAGETAAAQADVLARASASVHREITNVDEAMKINAETAKQHAEYLEMVSNAAKDAADQQARLNKFIEEGNREFDKHQRERNAAEEKRNAENKRGMEEYERGLLREFEIGQQVWKAAEAATDALNKKLEKKLELQTAFVTSLILEKDKARDVNTERNLGPGVPDAAGAAAAARDRELARLEAARERAPAFDFGPMVQKIWQDFDAAIIEGAKARGAAGTGPLVKVDVSGILDPATVQQWTDIISAELMRRSGRR